MKRKKAGPPIKQQQPSWEEWVSANNAMNAAGSNQAVEEAVAKLAYSYWESRGGQGGSAEQDWLRAEAEIR